MGGSRFPKAHFNFFQFGGSLPQAGKQKETYFATRKILQNFEDGDDWHCKHITLGVICSFPKWAKYGHFMLGVVFPDKVTPDIDFADVAVVQCKVTVVKLLL